MSKFFKSVLSSLLITLFLGQSQYKFSLHAEAVEYEYCHDDEKSHPSVTGKEAIVQQEPPPRRHSQIDEKCRCPSHGEEGAEARIAYLITLHNERTLKESLRLLKTIVAPGFIVLIHIDKKFPKEKYENDDLIHYVNDKTCNCCGADVSVDSVFDAEWGQWSMMEPTIWAMQQLTANPRFKNKWDVFINLSADSMPVYTPNILSQYFKGPLNGINFVTALSCSTGLLPTNIDYFPKGWHKYKHYKERGEFQITYNSKYDNNKHSDENEQDVTTTLTIHFGSQWMTLTPSFVEYIASSMTKHDSLPYRFKEDLISKQRLMTDETFIPTLITHHSTFKKTLPTLLENGDLTSMEGMSAIRYERMDEHMPDAFMTIVDEQRYEVPEEFETELDVPRPWGPYYLGTYDLGNIKDTGALFIRKVAKELDDNLFSLLPVSDRNQIPGIYWPKEVKISSKIDF